VSPTTQIQFGRFTIEVVPLDQIDLLEKNARYMRAETFRRLVDNIKKDGQLSQIPFCVKKPSGRFLCLSGNHRVQGARAAGLHETPVIWIDDALVSREEQLAIQLSHNAIAGEDDATILKELWDELQSIDAKLYSGLDDKQLAQLAAVQMPAISEVRLDFRTATFLFLPEELERVNEAFAAAKAQIVTNQLYLARFGDFDRLLDALEKVGASYGIRNGATSILILLDIFARHHTDLAAGWFNEPTLTAKHKGWVPLSSILGTDTVPAEAAVVIKQAVDKMQADGDVDETSRWQAIEKIAADYLAGA
jgi:hypothetical protein